MLAAVLVGKEKIELMDRPKPTPGRGEVIVKVVACGICQTDYSGFLFRREQIVIPSVLGHEISGVITAVGEDVPRWHEGDEVVVMPMVPCGDCYYCKTGFEHYCEHGEVIGGDGQKIVNDGGFQEYVKVPAKVLFRKPKNVSFESAALTEPLAGSYKGLVEYSNFQVNNDVVVIGAGGMGLLITMIALRGGAGNLIVVDISDYNLNKAKELGVKHLINPQKEDVKTRVYEISERGPDIIMEAAGTLAAADMAMNLARRYSFVNMFGVIIPGNIEVSPAKIHWQETRINASFSVNRRVMEKSLELMGKGLVQPDKLVTHRFSLEKIVDGMQFMSSRERVKVMIVPGAK
jgi:threonine dehydrogenase-like Zn-dependent dehydrogenase